MPNPWDNDPVVAPAAKRANPAAPWEADPVVDEEMVQTDFGMYPKSQVLEITLDAPGKSASRRGLELGGRSVLQGIGGLVGALGGDAFNGFVVDPVRKLFHGEGEFQPTAPYRDVGARIADELGLYAPQDKRERVLGDIGEGLTGTGLTLGAGGLANTLAKGGATALAPLGELLTAQPVQQVIGTALGTGASSNVRENGGGTGAQIAAALAGGMAPGAVTAGGGAMVRGAARGRSGADMQQVIDDFAELGATPSVGQATGSRFLQGAENVLGGGPTSAGVIGRFVEKQADDIGTGLRAQADGLKKNASAEAAGRAIERGIEGPGGFRENFKGKQQQLYDRLDTYIPGDSRIGVNNTRESIGALNAPIDGAPNTSRLFQNARIRGVGEALEQDLAIPTDAQKSLDDALTKLDDLYNSRDGAMQEAGKFKAFENEQANKGSNFYPVPGMPRFPGRYSEFPTRAGEAAGAADDANMMAGSALSRAQQIEDTLGNLRDAAAATNGRLPYQAIKKLRTLVGQELDDAGLMSDFPRSKWTALYGSLSKDLEAAATEAGPEALQAFRRANTYTRAGMDRMELISRVVDAKGGPEKIFQSVMAGTKDGATTLRAVMRSLPDVAQRKALTAAVIKRMGLATKGQQDMAGEQFSAASFLTNWNGVSKEAKQTLFNGYGPGFAKDMDTIARVAENIKTGSKVMANPSGTANRAASYGYVTALIGSLFADPTMVSTTGLIGGGVAANAVARGMTNPKFVKWLARETQAPRGSAIASLNALRNIANDSKDDELLTIYGELKDASEKDDGANDE